MSTDNHTYASITREIEEINTTLDEMAPQISSLATEIDALYGEYFRTDREAAKTAILQEVARLEKRKYSLHERNFQLLDQREELEHIRWTMRREDMMHAGADY